MENYVIIAVIVVALAAAIRYMLRSKKSGSGCIGCPHAKTCSSKFCPSNNEEQ